MIEIIALAAAAALVPAIAVFTWIVKKRLDDLQDEVFALKDVAMFNIFKTRYQKDKERFLWALAEALLWRDGCPSMGAIPSPIKEQPNAKRYYEDAKYVLEFVLSKTKKAGEE
jgi:hypothetical protein